MLWLVDNYDSFTFNIVHYLSEVGHPPRLVKNDELTVDELKQREVSRVVLSPGPSTPDNAGITLDAIRAFAATTPILGICLGHEAIGQAFGAKVVHARRAMHGKVSEVHHDGAGVFRGLPSPLKAARYHSLIVDKASLPASLKITAWTAGPDGEVDEIMGLRHIRYDIEGVQFHPEAILSEHGHEMFRNFCDQGGKGRDVYRSVGR
jgi:anthranilate synthase component II